MRTSLVFGALATMVGVGVGVAHADLQTGKDKLTAGDYKTAIAELTKVTGKDRAEAQLLLGRAQTETGDYAGAEKTLGAITDVPGHLLLAQVRMKIGKHADARKDLEALYKAHPDDRAVRTLLGVIRYDMGDALGAKALFDETIKESDRRKLNLDDPIQMWQLAIAAEHTGNYSLANDAYREVAKGAPQMLDAGVAWADLFVRKYAAQLAEQTLEEVFKINPNHPDAHAAMADVITQTSYDLQAVRHHLEAAFAVNPKHTRALRVRASIEIDNNNWEAAKKTLDEVLAIDPEDVHAIAQKATIAWLRDDMAGYEAEKKKAFAIDPQFAELYEIVSRSAEREHRYVQAIELDKEAVKLKPDYYEAMAAAGLGYLRMGQEKEGLEWIEKSWAGDEYNVRAYNTRHLFKDTIPKEYAFGTTKSFRIRYHNEEKPVLSRYLEPTMERAFASMVARYGFTPKLPVTIELYADRNDYGIRTVGLPDIAALGVCFGQVITAMSPATGDINWGMVLWHELGHVFAIQLSNSRVPRWFTEGLSEYETLTARPDWRRENDTDLYTAYANGTLPSIGDLNAEFMQPDQNAVVVAYFQSAVTIEYLASVYGFPKIVEALKLFGQGKESVEVLKIITGKSIAQLDADFHKFLDVRLAAYKGTFALPKRGFDDLTKLEIAADAAPKDPKAKANIALGYYYGGDAEKAAAAAEAALAMDPKNAIARYIQAEVQMHGGDVAKAKAQYESLAADGHDSYDIRTRLAQIAQQDGDMATVVKMLCAAKKLDPERSYPYEELAKIYKKQGQTQQALTELEHYAFLEQMELSPLKELTSGYAKLGNWAKVRTFGEMATYINPNDADILLALGRAYSELGNGNQALFTYDSALLLNPPPRRPALLHLGRARAYLALGKKADAKAALALAMKTEPENAEVLELKAKL